MVDFNEMAKQAKAAHDQKTADEDAATRAKAAARRASVSAAVQTLQSDVIPLLGEAKTAFAINKIESEIIENFDVNDRHESVRPSVVFKLLGPRRASDGYRLEGPKAYFESTGDYVQAGFSRDGYRNEPTERLGSAKKGEGGRLVEQALQKAVDNYHSYMGEHGYYLDR